MASNPTPDERLLLVQQYAINAHLPYELAFYGLGVPSNTITMTSPNGDWRWSWCVSWDAPEWSFDWEAAETTLSDNIVNLTQIVTPKAEDTNDGV